MDGSDEQRHLAYLSSFSQNYQSLNIAPSAPPSLRSMFSDGYRSNPLNIYNMRGDSSMAPYGSSFGGSYNIRPADMGINGMMPSHAMQLSAEAYLPAELRYNNFPPTDPAKNSSYQAYISAAMRMNRARGCLPGTSSLASMSSDDLRNSGLLQRSISSSSNNDGTFSRSSVHLSTDSSIDYAGDEKLKHELPKLKAHGNKRDSFSESCDQSITNQLQPPPPLHTPVVQSQPSPYHMSHQPPPPPPLHTPMIRPAASIVIQPVELSDSDDEDNSSNVDRKLSLEVETKPLPPLQIGNKALAEKMAEHSKQLSQLSNSETMPPIKMKVLPVETDAHSPVSTAKYGDYDVMPGVDPTVVYISDADGALLSRQMDSDLNGEGIASSGVPDSSSDMWQQQTDSYGSLSQPQLQLSDYFVSKVSPENGNLVYNRNWHQNSRFSGGYPYLTPSYSEMSSSAMDGARRQAYQMPSTTRNFGQAFSSNTAESRSALYETNNSAAQFRHRQRRRNRFRTGWPYRFAPPFLTPGIAFNSNLSGHQMTSPTSVSDIYDNSESNMSNYHNQDMSSNDMMNASRNQSRGLETDMAANLESVLANMKQESPGENNEMNTETAMEMDNHSAEKDFVNEDQTTSIDRNNGEMICVQDEDGNNMVCTIASMTGNANNFNKTPINPIHGKSKNSSFMNNNKFHYWNGFKTGRESGDFRCHLCNYSGRSQHCLNKHYRAHKQAGKICRYCLRAFERPSDLVRHEDRHRKRNHPMQSSGIVMEAPSFSARRARRQFQLLSCSKCPFTCRDAFKLSKHTARMHASKFECNKCAMKFSTGALLDRHKLESHPVAVGRIDSYVNGVLTKTNLVSCEVNGENDFSISFVEISEQLLDVSTVAEVSSAKDAMNILNQWFNKDQNVQVAQNSQSEQQLNNQSSDGMQSKEMSVDVYVSASKEDPFVLKKNENPHGNVSKDVLVPIYSVPSDGVSALNNLINIVNCNINSNKSSYSSIPIFSNKPTHPIKPSYTELRRLIASSPTSLPSFIVSSPTVLPSLGMSSPTIHPTSSKAISSPVPTTMDVVSSDNVVQQTDSSVSTNNLDVRESETYLPTSTILQDNQDETSTDTQGYAIETKYELCPMDLNPSNNRDINKNKIFLESIEPEEIMVFVKQEPASTEVSGNLDNPFATDDKAALENLKTDERKVFAEHNGNVFVCVRCKYSTGAKFKYLQHLKAHSGRFICKHCNKACIKSSDLYRHWTSHNVKGPDGNYACDSCEFTSPRKDEVESHMKVHYNLNRDLRTRQNAGVMSRCGMCLKNVLRSRLFEHKRMAHGKFFIKPRVGSAELKTELGENEDTVSKSCKLYKCPKCERSLTTPSYLLRHYFDLHQQDEGNTLDANKMKTPLCRFCSVELDDVEKLHEHEVSHVMSTCVEQSGIARQVKKEDPAISVKMTLQNHIANRKVRSRRKHKKQSPGKDQKGLHCPHCNKVFKQQYYLNEHMHLHSGELPYECKQCTARFALFQSLVMHQMHKHPIDAYQGGKKIASFKKKYIAPSHIDQQVNA